ncbi:DUF2946 family protein [Tardiphaga sp.]|uniref:DUF2946 family protein n=1 Tax=Tardiphaga sp. TaxID=1926292 RepID=UPI002626325B|nr:DUF2946 family protein [Tardiphaga sp.]MDB5616685.1 hypothetical protein [Tardiphaga sp.]
MQGVFGMNWFRRHITQGSRLALFALAIQMVLAFGHFHADRAVASPGGASIELAQPPAGPAHDQHPADQCDICAVTAMAGTMLSATPPVLELPPAMEFRRIATPAEFVDLATPGVAFQPRAPPLS